MRSVTQRRPSTANRLLCSALFTLCGTFLANCQIGAVAAPPSGYSLVWSDEFNQGVGQPPSSSHWAYDTGAGGWGNNELETYTTNLANAHIVADPNATDGMALQIEAEDTNGGVGTAGTYTSARIKTQSRTQTFEAPQYGFLEARIKMPYGDGIWPAFWMLGTDFYKSGWPACGEADIMENIGMQSWWGENASSLHGPTGSRTSTSYDLTASYFLPSGQYFYSGYHLFQELWLPNSISYYVDGNLFETHSSQDTGGYAWPFNQPMFFVLNVAVGGNWPGNPDASTVFPQDMLVDYVRVYEPTNTSGPPYTPYGLLGTAGDAKISLAWPASSGATSYNVYRGTTSNGEGATPITSTTNLSYTDTGLTNGTTYYYKVAAVNSSGTSGMSSETSCAPVVGPRFTAAATTTPSTVTINSPVTINTTITDVGAAASGIIVDCEIYNSSGTRVNQQYTTGQTFTAGQSQSYTYSWTPTTSGTYTVELGVFSANWTTNYTWNSNAATITVN